MNSGDRSWKATTRLATLARQLRRDSCPPPLVSGACIKPPKKCQLEIPTVGEVSVVPSGGRSKIVRAAVLVCLFEGDGGDLRVILIKRASTLSSHSGEVALRGGKRDEGDANDVETALREAKEEIGLNPSIVEVVTILKPFVSVRGILVVPVVGILSDKKLFQPVPNPDEVELILDAPLDMFLKDEKRRAEEMEVMGHRCLLHFFDYETPENERYVIFALTAGILIEAASVVYQRTPDFEVQGPKLWH